MLTVSNIYGHGFGAREVSALETLGFRIRPQVYRYMGAQLCRFIDFDRWPILELIEVEDEQEYRDFLPDGMLAYCPGISVAVPSAGVMAGYERELEHLRPYTLHVNYDGTTEPPAAGWKYLNFGVPMVQDTFTWLTSFDDPRPARTPAPTHPNTVECVAGMVFDLETSRLSELRRLARGGSAEGEFSIGDLKVWSKDVLDASLKMSDKQFPLVAMVLKARSLDAFAAHTDLASPCTFMSRPAVHIATNSSSWDMVVVA